jgi:hypothetical protein
MPCRPKARQAEFYRLMLALVLMQAIAGGAAICFAIGATPAEPEMVASTRPVLAQGETAR